MTRQLLTRSRSQLCAELEYDIWNFCSLNPFRLNQGLKTLFRIAYDRSFIIRQDRFGSAFSKADKRLAKLFLKRRSYFGNMIVMKRKFRFFFGYITKTELGKRVAQLIYFQRQNPHLGGFENLFRVFERRLDFLSMRLRFVFNLKEARFFILEGNMSVNGVCQIDPSFVVQLGDIVSPSSYCLRAFFYKTYYIFWYDEYIAKSGPLRGRFLLNLFRYIILRYRNDYDFSLCIAAKNVQQRMSPILLHDFLHRQNFFLSNWFNMLSNKTNIVSSLGFNNILHRQRLLVLLDGSNIKRKTVNFVNTRCYPIDSFSTKEKDFNNSFLPEISVNFLRYFYLLYFFKDFVQKMYSHFRLLQQYTQFYQICMGLKIFDRLSANNALKSEAKFVFSLKNRLYQFIFLRFLFYNTVTYSEFLLIYTSQFIRQHNSLIGKFVFPAISDSVFNYKVILLSRLDFYINKFKFIGEYFKSSVFKSINISKDSTFVYSVYLRQIFRRKRFQTVLTSTSFFQQLLFFVSRLEQISWGFLPLVFRDSLLDASLEDLSVRNVYFSYRSSMRLWSVSQIEKMYNAFIFLEETARTRQNFSKVKKREYSFFLIASTSFLDNYFLQTFKSFTAVNFLLFVYLRTAERENEYSLDFSLDSRSPNSATIVGATMGLEEEEQIQEDEEERVNEEYEYEYEYDFDSQFESDNESDFKEH
jgi:hypothetical protein